MTQWDGFPTPETIPTTCTLRLIAIPDDRAFIAAVGGAILKLTEPEQWKAVGAVTPDEVAYASLLMMEGYWNKMLAGTIIPYITANPPPYTLPCEGGTFSREDYPFLYAVVDPVFQTDADHFILPDLRGRTVVGSTALAGYGLGDAGGESEVTLGIPQMPSHTHTDSGHTHAEGIAVPALHTIIPPDLFPSAVPGIGSTAPGFAIIQPTGGGLPHNNMQPYVALKYAVFYA